MSPDYADYVILAVTATVVWGGALALLFNEKRRQRKEKEKFNESALHAH